MTMRTRKPGRWLAAMSLLLLGLVSRAEATVPGMQGPNFDLLAMPAYINTPDADSLWIWGYGDASGFSPQYPGPTLIVDQGDTVTVNLTNMLPAATSMVFPGQVGVTASGGASGLLTQEASALGGSVNYTFTAGEPGTYLYHSGSHMDFQVEMGLMGALIVRPTGAADQAYGEAETAFDREYLFVLSEMDPRVHDIAEVNDYGANPVPDFDFTEYFSTLWFINGRNGPDTTSPDGLPWMPYQPYGSLARMHPGETVLARVVGGGRESHPFHIHGNHGRIVGRDGRVLNTGSGIDLSREDFTIQSYPGSTYDVLWTWTGEQLGWDIYGTPAEGRDHLCVDNNADTFDDATNEYCPDHYKTIPVVLPENQDLTFGGFYSGTAFLGGLGSLPPGEGGLNVYGGLFFMWHSHTEKELTNNDIFPGGMMTMMIVEPLEAPID